MGQYYGDYHPAGWIDTHGSQAVAGMDACTKCHEVSILKVGSGVPTCLTTGCHHQSTVGFADPAVHGVRAKLAVDAVAGGSLASCQICHGKDFSGGPSANACATCHGVPAPHPAKPWRSSGGSVYTHTTTDPSNAAVCAQCHYPGSPHNPAGHPATPAPAGTQPGCYNATLCHGANTAPHPVPFLAGQTDSSLNGHLTVTATAFAADCATCHAYSGASPLAAAPLCNVCHQLASPTAPGTNAGTCLSCHAGAAGLPSGPGGSSFPSVAGAHGKHLGLATQLTCDTCHAGSGTGTTTHYMNADQRLPSPVAGPATVAIDPAFSAKTGGNPAFTAASLTCSNVSCHGGQTTPGWQNGTIDSSTQCLSCHGVAASAGTATQYNDAFGRHSIGTHDATVSANGTACTTCHNMGNGSPGALAHFKYLNTQAVDGVNADGTVGVPADQLPSGTIVFDPTLVTAPGTYAVTSSTQGNGGCALTCHTHIHAGAPLDTWQSSGAPHPVPFLTGQTTTQGHGHMTATTATFAADCATCHAYSGTSPTPGAPLCSVCHTLADPTQAATGTGTCLSCHAGSPGLPAGPAGAAFPSLAGAHAKHMALPTPLTCDTCHTGSGSGTALHYSNANARVTTPTGPASVSLDATYNAQSGGAAGFNPASLTCSSTSCHGGQITPNWRTGTLSSASQCSLCHAINGGATTSQYNDAVGRHAWGTHAAAGSLDCTICHDMSSANPSPGAVNHFAELNTTAVSSTNKLPSGTIKFKLTNSTYPITGAATYDVTTSPFTEGDGGCALTCHSQNHVPATNHWAAPQGSGVAHPVPFHTTDVSTGGNHHQTVTLAQFNGECINCHDQSGTTAKAGPVCTVCHTLGSPLTAGMTAGTCLSCHVGSSFPTQGPTGTAWPSLQGAHPSHLALLTFTRTTPALPASLTASAYPVCEACHGGSVPGDTAQTHYSNANLRAAGHPTAGPASVSVDPTFNAQSGATGTSPSAAAFTCSNVSCHGGQTTPGWQSGTLVQNATTYCLACHKVASTATQYNDATGRHNNPGEHNQTCDYCHVMTQTTQGAVNHFKYLDTTAVRVAPDQLSSDTIKFGGGSQPATGALTYTPTGTLGRGGCALTCHGQTHTTSNNVWN
ncbi:MAG: CxxxxCH/CxxCH domain-containing protein [Geothrix sp.]|nr:CxxxxCH/CxxCH domain-containing protein [Geothrix sp.]